MCVTRYQNLLKELQIIALMLGNFRTTTTTSYATAVKSVGACQRVVIVGTPSFE